MRYLKTITTDGNPELFNGDHIINITPMGDTVKILCGAGLYWQVRTNSLEWLESPNDVMAAIQATQEIDEYTAFADTTDELEKIRKAIFESGGKITDEVQFCTHEGTTVYYTATAHQDGLIRSKINCFIRGCV